MAAGFPALRVWAEVTGEVMLAAEVAARLASIYSPRKTGYGLRSARVLGEWGYRVEVRAEGAGLSGQGTPDDQLYSGDVRRKLLGTAEQQQQIKRRR